MIMNKFLAILLVFIVSANCLIELPPGFIVITHPADVAAINANMGYRYGLAICRSMYYRAGGEIEVQVFKLARKIVTDKITEYYIAVNGRIGVHEFIFRATKTT